MTTPAEVMEERGLTARALLRPRLRLRRLAALKHLLDDITWRGGAETLVLLCAVFTVWLLTTFEATYFDITGCQTQIAVLTAMVLGLFMNAAIDVASSAGGWAFVVPLVVTQVARGIVTSTTAPDTAATSALPPSAHLAAHLRPLLHDRDAATDRR
jgi:Bacterial low temperature requirement A protein (LtrA)